MSKGTVPFHNRIALVFDFDETLAPDTFAALLEHCDIDPQRFKEEKIKPMMDAGWDELLARFYCLRQEAKEREDLTLTKETFAEVGENLTLYPEAGEMFGRVHTYVHDIMPETEVEFYLLTAGMLEIPRATAVAEHFRVLWGGELHFDENGEFATVKRIVSHPEKIRYILKLCKGLDIEDPQIAQDVYREIPDDEWHLPLENIVYVGDGDSDMPVFAYLKEKGGLAIGVFQGESSDDWEGYEDVHEQQRVQNLAPSDLRADSELMQSIRLAVESIAKRLALREFSVDE